MSTTTGRLRYNDILVAILVVLIGLSLFLTSFFAVRFREDRSMSDTERISYRNQLIQLRLETRLAVVSEMLLETAVQNPAPVSMDQLRRLVAQMNADSDNLFRSEWLLFDPENGTMIRQAGSQPGTVAGDLPDWSQYRGTLGADGSLVTLFRETVRSQPRLCLIFGERTAIGGRYRWAVLIDTDSIPVVLDPLDRYPSRAELVDWTGSRLLELDMPRPGSVEASVRWTKVGFLLKDDQTPYLGIMNAYLARPNGPQVVQTTDAVHSMIPVPSAGIFLILQEPSSSAALSGGRSLVLISLLGTALYGIIITLFVSYRRMAIRQTHSLESLSEQKNLLFSLLSHNLKNNLAAVAAEAQQQKGSSRILAPVTDASRVISNSLYYLQFQEHAYTPPPAEDVEAEDIVEFLVLRCEQEAAARGQTIRPVIDEQTRPLRTNLSMALEALERILVNAIQYSPENTEIVVSAQCRNGSPTICIRDNGPGLPQATVDMLVHKGDAALSSSSNHTSLRGIGLYIARKILESLGATMSIRETGASGTTMSVTFPSVSSSSHDHVTPSP